MSAEPRTGEKFRRNRTIVEVRYVDRQTKRLRFLYLSGPDAGEYEWIGLSEFLTKYTKEAP